MYHTATNPKLILTVALLLTLTASANEFSTHGLLYPQVVAAFYQTNEHKDVWTDERLVKQLQQAIAAAYLHGLQPTNYHYVELEAGSDALRTDAFIAYAHDLHFGRAAHLLKGEGWQIPHKDSDLMPVLQDALNTGDIRTHLDSLAPSFESYKLLQKQLELYRELAANIEWRAPEKPLDLEKGDPEQLNLLQNLIRATGDLTEGMNLIDGVMHFQSRHGLDPDGVVGKQTIAALKVSAAQRVTQIEVNLERMRWLPHELPQRFVLVNVPAFELRAYEQHELADTMKVVVGRRSWCTPTFLSSEINRIIVNPYWYVPSAIARKEIYPLLQKEPDYLEKNAIQVVQDSKGDVQLRQSPGERNSLGRIKFLFPNCCDCYLHDTPEKRLFDKVLRSFSHGCIRVEDAFRLGDWILEREGWSGEDLDAAIESGKTQTIVLSNPVPIYIVYFTAWVESDGSVQFRGDVYGKDAELARAVL